MLLRSSSTASAAASLQVPGRADLPPLPRAFQKKPRPHAHWKLRPARRLRDVAGFVRALRIEADPAEEGTSGCKELRRQALAPAARAAFPKCVVEAVERADGAAPMVTVAWADGQVQRVQAAHMTFLDILDALYPKALALQRAEEDKEM